MSLRARIFISFLSLTLLAFGFILLSYPFLSRMGDLSSKVAPIAEEAASLSARLEAYEGLEGTIEAYLTIGSAEHRERLTRECGAILKEARAAAGRSPENEDVREITRATEEINKHVIDLTKDIERKTSSYSINRQIVRIFEYIDRAIERIKKMRREQARLLEDNLQRQRAIVSRLGRYLVFIEAAILAASAVLAILLTRFIIARLTLLRGYMKEVSNGRFDATMAVGGGDEFGQLAKDFNAMARNLKATTTSIETLNEEVLRRRKAQEELTAVNKELSKTQEGLIQSEKTKALGELTAGISHEFNQHLNVIKIVSQSLLKDVLKDTAKKDDIMNDLPEIIKQVDYMAEIVGHMKFFTERSAAEVKELFSVNDVVENGFKFTQQQLVSAGIDLRKELARGLPDVRGESVQIEKVFLNILSNAKNAVRESAVREKRIGVRTYPTEDQKGVVIEVRDNGTGIPADDIERIFQPFFTTREALAPDGRPVKGKGLGLSVASRIVEEHGGRIEVSSEAGGGSVFKVVLPADERRAEDE